MTTQALETIEVPLRKLTAWSDNVRTTPLTNDDATKELAASIEAVGLLHSLVVQGGARGKYKVVAGRRRLIALTYLLDAQRITQTYKVPCRLLPADADLSEISLAENVEREDMDPLDECMAFQRLVHGGKSIPDIAARLGYSENLIERRLALACLSPFVLDQYRAGKATLELLQAFTLTNDHAAQEHVWNQLPDWNRQAQSVRRLLSHRDIPASDAQVRYVTLSAYEAAGGATKRDLFADEEGNGVYVTDAELLTTLVTEKLQQAAARIEKDGWSWVDIRLEADYSTLARYRHIQGDALPLTRKEQARRGALAKEHDALADQLGGNEEDTEEGQALYDRIESLEEEIRAIDSNTKYAYPDHVKQNAGVIVTLAEDGQPRYHYGLVRKEDEAPLAKSSNDTHEPPPCDEEEGKEGKERSAYSAALVETLTAHKTAAIATELSRQPHAALAATVYTLLLREFSVELDICSTQSALQISEQHTNLREAEDSAAGKALSERRQELLSILPRGSKLWPWCLEQTVETLLECLAFLAAISLNAVQTKADSYSGSRLVHANAIAAALHMDMTHWFAPNTENFFTRISKTHIAAALAEAGKPADASRLAMKKSQLAAAAEIDIAGTGWLPLPLRVTSVKEL